MMAPRGSLVPAPIRLWRARRRHDHLDAVVAATAGRWVLQFLLNDRLIVSWPFDTKDGATEEADARLRELQRAGWNTHW
jgi:hypothetical protein